MLFLCFYVFSPATDYKKTKNRRSVKEKQTVRLTKTDNLFTPNRPFVYLPFIIDTETEQFFYLKIAVPFRRLGTVVIAGVHIELGGKIAVQHKVHRVFPFNTCPLITGLEVQAGIQRNGRKLCFTHLPSSRPKLTSFTPLFPT